MPQRGSSQEWEGRGRDSGQISSQVEVTIEKVFLMGQENKNKTNQKAKQRKANQTIFSGSKPVKPLLKIMSLLDYFI